MSTFSYLTLQNTLYGFFEATQIDPNNNNIPKDRISNIPDNVLLIFINDYDKFDSPLHSEIINILKTKYQKVLDKWDMPEHFISKSCIPKLYWYLITPQYDSLFLDRNPMHFNFFRKLTPDMMKDNIKNNSPTSDNVYSCMFFSREQQFIPSNDENINPLFSFNEILPYQIKTNSQDTKRYYIMKIRENKTKSAK